MDKFINLNNLKKIDTDINTFFDSIFEYNFRKRDFGNITFLNYTEGLIKFMTMTKYLLANKDYEFFLYEGFGKTDFINKKRFIYLIDNTGLIHGHIYAPYKHYKYDEFDEISENEFYGNGESYCYEFISNWNNLNLKNDLNTFKENYLPFKSSYEEGTSSTFRFYKISEKIIYRDQKASVIIPFQDFFKQNLPNAINRVVYFEITNYVDRVINFRAGTLISRVKKDPISNVYIGKICMNNFELLECKVVNEE